MSEALPMSDFQMRVLAIPECYDVFLGGGRAGAKSHTFALIALRHAEQYQDRARILYLRQSYKGLADFESMCRDLFGLIYGPRIRYNGAEHIFRFPDGGYLELGQLEGAADYGKYQGHSYTLLEVDEAGQYADPAIIDKLRSNLRGPKEMPIRQMVAANPGDVGHAWIAKRYVFKTAPWHPFFEDRSKRNWICAPSIHLDNPFRQLSKRATARFRPLCTVPNYAQFARARRVRPRSSRRALCIVIAVAGTSRFHRQGDIDEFWSSIRE